MTILISGALAVGCSSPTTSEPATSAPSAAPGSSTPAAGQRFPDVVAVEVSGAAPSYTFSVTLSSPYDTAQRYADAFRVRSADGTVFGANELAHDHAGEQPFTRTLSGVNVPAGVDSVVVEGRDKANGWGGTTRTVELRR